ncbi:MAG TPA: hypothetical protein VM847_02630, partial [Tahibacter sp.]|nr:hypothetical protein [Tahibacter sp.]
MRLAQGDQLVARGLAWRLRRNGGVHGETFPEKNSGFSCAAAQPAVIASTAMLVGLLRRACVGFGPVVLSGLMLVCAPLAAAPARPLPTAADDIFLAARDAVRSGDRERLAALAAKLPAGYPLAPYLAFWQLQTRLKVDDAATIDAAVKAFIDKHPNTYLADRLRLEWLLAVGARAEWPRFEKERAQLIWGDDSQIRCYAQLAKLHGATEAERPEAAREARRLLAATRESAAEGCAALADTLLA